MNSKWMIVLALSAGSTMVAQAAPTATAKAGDKVLLAAKGDKKAGKGNKAGAKAAQLFAPQMLEKILGKPLTDEQKKGVQAASDAYNESVAKSLGMTVDELKAKALEYRKNNPAKAGAKKAA